MRPLPTRLLLHKFGVFGLLLALHGVVLWLILLPTIQTSIDVQPGALDVRLLKAEEPAPPSDAEPDVAPQFLPVQVRIPEPNVAEPLEATMDIEQSASSAITADAPGSRPSSTGVEGEPELEAPDFEANYLSNPAPVYPPLSRQLREQGITSLRVHVSAEGKPLAIEIERSSGYERLDRAAISAVWQWRFVPARQGSAQMAAWVIVPVRFNLRR
ncbi:MAG: energy transducer TonB [Gammaproteobacteria bacterium]